MDALTLFAACGLFVASPAPCDAHPAQPATMGGESQTARLRLDHWQPYIQEASQRFGIPQAWIRAVMRAESAGLMMLDGKPITSSAGAMGLMQLMPDTWREMRDRYKLGSDPYDPRDNVVAGAAYLRQMYDRYGYPNLFAAYYAGPGRLDAYLAGLRPLPDATRVYVDGIVPGFRERMSLAPIDSHGARKTLSSNAAITLQNRPNTLFFALHGDQTQTSGP